MLMQHADAASPGLLRVEKVRSKLTTSAQTSSAAAGGPSSDRRASPRLQAPSSSFALGSQSGALVLIFDRQANSVSNRSVCAELQGKSSHDPGLVF